MNYLLLRGLARNTKHWHGFEKRLEGQVLLLDTFGNGEKANLNSPFTISTQTDLLRKEFLNLKKNEEPWSIIGLSLGGMIALDWISRFPNDFKKGLVINTSTKDVLLPWQRFDIATFIKLPLLLFLKNKSQEKLILNLTLNIREVNKDLIEANVNIYNKTTNFNFFRQLISAAFFKSPSNIQTKLIFIASKNDRLVNSMASVKLAAKYNSALHLHPTAGHDLPLDDPQWLESIIKNN